jgi:hypothetical protein
MLYSFNTGDDRMFNAYFGAGDALRALVGVRAPGVFVGDAFFAGCLSDVRVGVCIF